jgi:hypothetical protein
MEIRFEDDKVIVSTQNPDIRVEAKYKDLRVLASSKTKDNPYLEIVEHPRAALCAHNHLEKAMKQLLRPDDPDGEELKK